ncbi:MAG: aldehyde dehydrogenase [Deltaproteobacteria bacterium]|nr:aldehyde dehydrogenase [Deltaproteobacteria bacterium]
MKVLKSYLADTWQTGEGAGSTLFDPASGGAIATTSTAGLDLAAALTHARATGGPALRAMTFAERGALLTGISKAVHQFRDELLQLSLENTGTTLKDGKFDIDGATATLAAYGKYGEELGDRRFLLDGEGEQIGRSPRYWGQHVKVPRRGVAIHINAFNFPAWGWAEKLACAFLAGVPVLTKPATSTSLPSYRIGEIVVDSGLLPAGSWSLLCGGAGDLLDHVGSQDVIAFTGSAATGARIRGHANVIKNSVRVNVEADSLNAAVVGPDVEAGSETFALFIRELTREITQKAGQKCTATRRVFVPEALLDPTIEAMKEQLLDYPAGHPAADGVRMGTLATPSQYPDVRDGLKRLAEVSRVVYGTLPEGEGASSALVEPVLLVCDDPKGAKVVHEFEVFGPVVTIMPYSGDATEAADLVALGDGGLVATVYSDDLDFSRSVLMDIAPYTGRVLLGGKRIAEHSTGPGLVLPSLVHGGPGRAGGGLELGGIRGLDLYLQTCAVQGARPVLDRIL